MAAERLRRVIVADLEDRGAGDALRRSSATITSSAPTCSSIFAAPRADGPAGRAAEADGRVLLSIPNVGVRGLSARSSTASSAIGRKGCSTRHTSASSRARRCSRWLGDCGLHVTHSDHRRAADQPVGVRRRRSWRACRRRCCGRCSPSRTRSPISSSPRWPGWAAACTEPVETVEGPAFTYMAQLIFAASGRSTRRTAARSHGEMARRTSDGCRLAVRVVAGRLAALRLDPANRPGYLRLYA